MSVELDPPELGFKRPFTQEVSQVLRLHNPNNDSVAFKVKTTAPKQYCVRPNSGRIDAGKDVEVQVLLQAMKEDPPPDTKCRDKFLVQSVAIKTDTADNNVSQIWSNIEQNAKSSIQEKKIRVSFLPADGSSGATGTDSGSGSGLPTAAAAGGAAAAAGAGTAAAAASTNGDTSHAYDEPPSYSSPTPPATTPQRASAYSQSVTEKPSATTEQTTAETTQATTSLGTLPQSQEDLKAQLEEARATISRLQAQAAESLRQRKPQEAAEKAVSSVQQSMQNAPAPGGVPVQVVAILCLVAFLIAWIFF